MKFDELFHVLVEETEDRVVVEEGYKEIIAHIALLAAAGIGWNSLFELKKKARELKANPVEYNQIQNEVKQKQNDEKFNREILKQYNDKIVSQYKNRLEFGEEEYTPIKKDENLYNKSYYKNLENHQSFIKKAKAYIKSNETIPGKKYNMIYGDVKNKPTIGIGHLVIPSDYKDGTFKSQDFIVGKNGKKQLFLSDARIDELFEKDLNKKLTVIRRQFLGFDNYPENLKIVILDGFFRGDLSGSVNTKNLIREAMKAHFENKNRVAKVLLKTAARQYLKSREYVKYSNPKSGGTGIAIRMEKNAMEIENALDPNHQSTFDNIL
jgi:hypothetical protein